MAANVPAPPPPPLAAWRVSELRLVANALRILVGNQVFQHFVGRLLVSEFAVIKSWSHYGVVYYRGTARDLGNKVYSIFWNMLLGMAPYHDIHWIGPLSQRWPGVIGGHSHSGRERAGDFLEAVLGFWHHEVPPVRAYEVSSILGFVSFHPRSLIVNFINLRQVSSHGLSIILGFGWFHQFSSI
jgi:hypothetical protein